MTLLWISGFCACEVLCERPSKKGRFQVQCKAHDTTLETYAHNIRLKNETESIQKAERNKPQFQRR